MDMAWQRFRAAAILLARSGTVKERLQAAYRLELAHLDVDSLPDELRDDFMQVRASLTREKPLRGEDSVSATIRKLSTQEADDIAGSLMDSFSRMTGVVEFVPARGATSTLSTITPQATAQVIPLFAIAAEG